MTDHGALPATILKNTYSVTDLYTRLDMLQRFFEHYFFESGEPKGERGKLFSEFYKDADADVRFHVDAVAVWDGTAFESFTEQNLHARMQELKQAIAAVPMLTLYVPAHFTSAQIEPIGIWCRAYVQSNVLLDLHVDPDVVGGCAFVHNNAYHDISFSYFVEKERAALMQLVQKYVE